MDTVNKTVDTVNKVVESEPVKKAVSFAREFRDFAFKGNLIDLAVGVIVGAAFGKVVDSLVKHIMMPLIGLVAPGSGGYAEWKWVVNGQEIPYGLFLGELVNFLIVALAVFVFCVKFLGWIAQTRQEEPAAPSKQEQLLTEIRDLLRQNLQ